MNEEYDVLSEIHRILSTFSDGEWDDLSYDPIDGVLLVEKDGKTYEITSTSDDGDDGAGGGGE
jgi:hypothetical protein